ncbi:Helicase associated domain protein [Sphingorhabdus sp.]|uniref:Helicase associated domain protein n=1 Tax=Sphingorhabdus sp. TaxID=1902408 RepID=UPI004047E88D
MPSQLDTSKAIIADGIFDGLQNFSQLEERISKLGDQNTKILGDAFEIFIEGYIATQQKFQVEQNWVVGKVPLEVREQLNLSAHGSLGIDGTFRSRTGDLVPYQVKFRSGRPPLSYNEVASFLGITERAPDRIIFTNCNDVALDANNRDGMRSVRGVDLDELTADDFAAIEAWLKEKPAPVKKLSPRRYQQEAIDGICSTLSEHDRATAVLACGTGKTLIALWAVEKMRPKSVLVLLPSLTLVQQTLSEWSRHNSWGEDFTFICVCSDKTVAKNDDIQLNGMDVDFPVSTDPSDVRSFLERSSSRVKIVFSTYQSSPIVAEGVRGLNPFDIAVFDEAHKTTGPQAGLFATALLDEKIKIEKRLFLTATPRHYQLGKRDKDGNLKVVSMDNEAIYGPRAYTLTFGEAARQGIICDYKVIVAVVEGAEVNQFYLKHGITLVDGEQLGSSWVAKQIAVQRAIEETAAKRAISFHSRVSMAKEFASSNARGIGQYLEGFATFHANGEQKSFERKQILNAFRDAPKALITNARCLTEGIDIPAVDMVAFVDPRSSRVDIAQAAGRAMRKPRNSDKTVGYVVVPLFVERDQGETIEEALERTNYVDVIAVLNAMREQDDELTDIIQQLRQASGRGEIFNPKALADKVQILGPEVSLEALQASIYAEVIDRLGESWDEWFGLLENYISKNGNARVQIDCVYENKQLGTWCDTQRVNYKNGRLNQSRLEKLGDLLPHGWVWSLENSQREQNVAAIAGYFREFGHSCIRDGYVDSQGFNLYNIVKGLRASYNAGSLQEKWVNYLERELNFKWDLQTYEFICKYVALRRRFRRDGSYPSRAETIQIKSGSSVHKTLSMKSCYDSFRKSYLYWQNQETYSSKHAPPKRLSDREISLLEQIPNWRWNFDKTAEKLSAIRSAVETALSNGEDIQMIKALYVVDGYPLGRALSKLKYRFKTGTTVQGDDELIVWLEKKGYNLRPKFERQWYEKYNLFLAYVEEVGSADIKQNVIYKGVALGKWVSKQRVVYKDNRMPSDRIVLFDQLISHGWRWDASDSSASSRSKKAL